MQFSRIYNKTALDGQHDMAVSLVFSIFNPVSACSGGLSVSFYEDSLGNPYGGGIDGSLAYSPYTNTATGSSFQGLQNAYVGVGFDVSGQFSKKADGRTTGYFQNNPNTIVFRGSQTSNYELLSYTENLLDLQDISLGQDFTSEENAKDLKFRIILSQQSKKIKVQQIVDQNTVSTIAEQNLQNIRSSSYRVACAFVSNDNITRCKIKEFNVYGFSNDFSKNFDNKLNSNLFTCLQRISRPSYGSAEGKRVFLGRNNLFLETASNKSFSNYIKTIDTSNPYKSQQTIVYPLCSIHKFMDSDNDNLILVKESSTNNLQFYRNMGRTIVPEYTVVASAVSGFGESASIDQNLLFVSTVSAIEIYKRSGYSWNYNNSIINLSGRPYNINFKNNNGIVAYYDGSAQIFENNGTDVYTSVYYVSGIASHSDGFGLSLDINSYFAAIGAPYKDCAFFDDGSVFVFTKNTEWNLTTILSAGDNPSANFGNSVSLFDNVLAVGTPGNTVALNANAGVIRVYDLNLNGESNLRSTYPPINLGPNSFLGTEIDLKHTILAARTYNSVSVYSLCCAPAYIPPPVIPPCAIPLISDITPGYIKKIDTTGYVLTIQCPKPPLTPLSAFCSLITILCSDPMYSINGYDVLSPIFCPVTAVNVGL
jgi:hypothetical protein